MALIDEKKRVLCKALRARRARTRLMRDIEPMWSAALHRQRRTERSWRSQLNTPQEAVNSLGTLTSLCSLCRLLSEGCGNFAIDAGSNSPVGPDRVPAGRHEIAAAKANGAMSLDRTRLER
jgi:hypothetical protein